MWGVKQKVRLIRDCTPEVKTACVKVSVRCGISTAMAPVAVQIVTEEMYGHKYYLTKETIEKDPALAKYRQKDDKRMPLRKKQRLSNPEKKKAPSAKKDYTPYRNL